MRRDPVPEMVWTVILCCETNTDVLIWTEKHNHIILHIMKHVIKLDLHTPPTYPATLQDLTVSTKSKLGTSFGKFTQTTNGKVLFIQLFGCNQSLSLQDKGGIQNGIKHV